MKLPSLTNRAAGKNRDAEFSTVFRRFRRILALNNNVLEIIAEMERALGGEYVFDQAFLSQRVTRLVGTVREVVNTLNALAPDRYTGLYSRFSAIADQLSDLLSGGASPLDHLLVLPWDQVHRDLDHLVGSKNANLGELRQHLGLPTSAGFAVTTTAYNRFMDENGLFREIGAVIGSGIPLAAQSNRITELISQAPLPAEIETAIRTETTHLVHRAGKHVRFAVRSSAVGEDGFRTFAGQFLSLLDIRADEVPAACRRVMASRFSDHLLRYLGPDADVREAPVAVAVQIMVDAVTSGVIYTRDPNAPAAETMIISAISGRGEQVVGGLAEADEYTLARRHPFKPMASRIKAKPPGRPGAANIATTDPTTEGLFHGSAVLSLKQLRNLAELAMLLEKSFDSAQDIEWALAADGRLNILQCRPLRFSRQPAPPPADLAAELRKAPLIMSDRGHVVQLGVAAGRIVHVEADSPPELFPVNSIAVSRYASPQLSEIVRRAAAVITDFGSPTGHLATIAREYRTPALFGTGIATTALAAGIEATIDVEEKKVYAGILPGLVAQQLALEEPLADYPEMRTLRRLLRLLSPLHLVDPADPAFRQENCLSFHDILRFCHEKAVEALIAMHSAGGPAARDGNGRLLDLPVPLKIRVIDLEGAQANFTAGLLAVADVRSRPLTAILRGLLNREVWEREAVPFGFKDLMSSITRPLANMANAPDYSGENLAIIAENYCNLTLRLGYHFNVIDTYISDDPDDNYIYFRFVGGMAEERKRIRRLELIGQILTSLHFRIERQGDLLVGKAKMLAAEHLEAILVRLGELVAFTRQLDVRMVDDAVVEHLFAQFITQSRTGLESRQDR